MNINNKPRVITIDIETGALPEDYVKNFEPEFQAPGNYKTPEAKEKYIAEKKVEWYKNLALYAETGELLAIGYHVGLKDPKLEENIKIIHREQYKSEKDLILAFFDIYQNELALSPVSIGWNIVGFDMPFIFKRAWLNDIKPEEFPDPLKSCISGIGRFEPNHMRDLMLIFNAGGTVKYSKLNDAAKVFGMPLKLGDKDAGKKFAETYKNKDTQAQALEYLKRDVLITASIAEKIVF